MLNHKGYTIVEGIIAMLLVAIMVGGIFSALMASRRAIIEPTLKEEMMYSMEGVLNRLKGLTDSNGIANVCANVSNPLDCDATEGCNCDDKLPVDCKGTAGYPAGDKYLRYFIQPKTISDSSNKVSSTVYTVTVKIKCNGEVL